MNLTSHPSDSFDTKYLMLQTFSFLCGSLLTLIYIPHKTIQLEASTAALAYALLFMLAAAFLVSFCARLILPLLTAVFGSASAILSVMICSGGEGRNECIWLAVLMALAVPLHFIFVSLGLKFTDRVKSAINSEGSLSRGDYVQIYCAVFLAATISVLIAAAAVLYI